MVVAALVWSPEAEHLRALLVVPGRSEGAEECQAGMSKTRTVPNAVCLGSKVRETPFITGMDRWTDRPTHKLAYLLS